MIGDIAPRAEASSIRAEDSYLETELGLPAEVLRPLLEGARARGMADAFEMAGRAAIFFDGGGNALHVGALAARHLGDDLKLTGRQLVAGTAEGNRQLQAALGAALDGRAGEADLATPATGGSIRVTACPGPSPGDLNQLLRAILFLDKVETPAGRLAEPVLAG